MSKDLSATQNFSAISENQQIKVSIPNYDTNNVNTEGENLRENDHRNAKDAFQQMIRENQNRAETPGYGAGRFLRSILDYFFPDSALDAQLVKEIKENLSKAKDPSLNSVEEIIPYYYQALQSANSAIKVSKSNWESFALRGSIYYDLNQEDEALADFNRALELNPKAPFIHSNKAQILLNKGKNRDALKEINTEIELGNNAHTVYNIKGQIHESLQELDEARNCYKNIIDALKDSKDPIVLRAITSYDRLGKSIENITQQQREECGEKLFGKTAKKETAKEVDQVFQLITALESRAQKNGRVEESGILTSIGLLYSKIASLEYSSGCNRSVYDRNLRTAINNFNQELELNLDPLIRPATIFERAAAYFKMEEFEKSEQDFTAVANSAGSDVWKEKIESSQKLVLEMQQARLENRSPRINLWPPKTSTSPIKNQKTRSLGSEKESQGTEL